MGMVRPLYLQICGRELRMFRPETAARRAWLRGAPRATNGAVFKPSGRAYIMERAETEDAETEDAETYTPITNAPPVPMRKQPRSLAAVSPEKLPVFAFSDGGCSGNGTSKARASYAAVLTGGPFVKCVVRGELRGYEYEFVDAASPRAGVRATSRPLWPTNNRGEYFGLIQALLASLHGGAAGYVEIVSDSDNCVKTLNSWLPARLKKGTEGELKNPDLVMIAWGLLGSLRGQARKVVISWTKGHQKGPQPKSARARLLREGNRQADENCTVMQTRAETAPGRYVVEVSGGPAVLTKTS
jgi:ribonuclease HI